MNPCLLAQQVAAIPSTVPAGGGDALHTLATNGPMGAVCALLILAVVYLWVDSKVERKEATKTITDLNIRVATADSAKAMALIEASERHTRALSDVTSRAATELAQAKTAHMTALNDLHGARVADVNLSRQQMVEIVQSCTTALTANSSSLETQSQALAELREGIRDLSEESRASRLVVERVTQGKQR